VTGELPHEVALGVMRRANLFVRPTYFDGDASSVREALAMGVPVVASDTDHRPAGVLLFRRGDARDLADKIALALANGRGGGPRRPSQEPDSFEQLLAIYARLGTPARQSGGMRHAGSRHQ
jgi:glycosyltransferase involved in cell wall biosynthesis